MHKLLPVAAAFMAAPAAAQQPAPPKLIVAISVDQLSGDLFDQYRPHFRGGLARLSQQGTVFARGFQSHAASETCPGHSTIMTGARPARTGIIANSWIDQAAQRTDKTIYCAEDERVAGSTFAAYTVSPEHLRVTTVGERLKASNPATRNVAVAGKDRAAVMMSGHRADQRWYWDGKQFATDLKDAAVPRTVSALNQALAASLAAAQAPLLAPALCQSKSKPYQVAPNLTVGTGRLERAAGDIRGVRATPEFDGAVLAIAAGLVGEMGLGRGNQTDVLSIGLSATDYVGHSYGSGGPEMCLQLLALDRELGDFFAQLDRNGIDYAVVLTADHGGMDIPERLRDAGVSGSIRADPALAASEIGKLLAPRLGLTGPVLRGEGLGGDVWLDAALPPASRTKALAAAVAAYRAHPQVHAVFTAEELGRTPLPTGVPDHWSILQRVRASFDPRRSGDLLVVLKQFVSPIAKPSKGYTATHGSPWDYDRRVPIIFWRKGGAAVERTEAIETVDIMPTLSALVRLPVAPGAIDGRCLPNVLGVRCSR
ncbi:alkaline phosphatase family protein [Sphingomonas sp. GCM10030256]|uniref:alkaline phosphatase family protein n=1 Tax=Sphingomonas sp. GCM10030256 TaxID=3273427 RepID=UPI003613D123